MIEVTEFPNDGEYRYVPDPEWRKGIKQMHATERRLLAHSYRELRRRNPAMARLLYRRSKEVMQGLLDEQLFGEGTCDLLNDFK